jgi:hypothetical protein
MATAELVLRYRAESSVSTDGVRLATASPHDVPVFFDGFAEHPAETAQALLCVARVARTRFYEPPGMVAARLAAADPVVTAESDRLRFESFSACCGVHARFDLDERGMDVSECTAGTTNVDFNPPMREALARVTRRDPLRLTVGAHAVEVHTLDADVIERRVPLPQRWVKGFGEVQVALAGAQPLLELDAVQAQRFLRGLPRGNAGHATMWAEPGTGVPRLATTRRRGAVCVTAPNRLRALEPLARFCTGLSAHGDSEAGEPTSVAWVLKLAGGRASVTLSPDRARGFSGEGGLLFDLVSGQAASDAEAVRELTHGLGRFSLDDATGASGLGRERTAAALTWLGVHGHLGFDAAERVYFKRRLPYPDDALIPDPPRLRDARKLADEGAVSLQSDGSAKVNSEGREYRSTLEASGYRCTCQWIAKHGTSRGPCKHVLATEIVRRRAFQDAVAG